MKDLTILVVEDEFSWSLEIEMMLHELGYEKILFARDFESANRAFESKNFDFALLDIHLKNENGGLELAKMAHARSIPFVFSTSFREDAVFQAALKEQPMAYLVKPFEKLTLASLLEKVEQTRAETAEKGGPKKPLASAIFVKLGSHLERVELENIHYLMAEGNYTFIYYGSKRVAQKSPLKNVLEQMPSGEFLQVHKSWAVQLSKIEKLELGKGFLKIGDAEIPIGRAYKEALMNALKRL